MYQVSFVLCIVSCFVAEFSLHVLVTQLILSLTKFILSNVTLMLSVSRRQAWLGPLDLAFEKKYDKISSHYDFICFDALKRICCLFYFL